MSLKAIVDEVPEGLADHYTKRADGKFQLAVDPVDGFALEDVSGLRRALEDHKEKSRTLVEKLKVFDGLSADDVHEKLAELDDLRKVANAGGDDKAVEARIDAAAAAVRRGYQSKLKTAEARSAELLAEVDKLRRQRSVQDAITEAGGIPELLSPHVLGRTKMVENDGKFGVCVIDDDGSVMRNSTGDALTPADFVAQLKQNPAFAPAFKASGASGTGKAPSQSSNGGLKRSAMSAAEKMSYLQQHSQEDYLKLPE